MTPPRQPLSPQRQGRIDIAIEAIQKKRISSLSRAATLYRVPRSTLQGCLQGARPHDVSHTLQRKLQPAEEQTLVEWILDLDRRGFPP
jgi:hypothetical protein